MATPVLGLGSTSGKDLRADTEVTCSGPNSLKRHNDRRADAGCADRAEIRRAMVPLPQKTLSGPGTDAKSGK